MEGRMRWNLGIITVNVTQKTVNLKETVAMVNRVALVEMNKVWGLEEGN
jgi:hypothetical protein